MRQTREQRLTELLKASTTNTTATSMVHATIANDKVGWAWFLFGVIGGLFAGAQHHESGFAMIDGGKIYFYKVTGLGKKETIEGRREIVFDRIEKVRRARGGKRLPASLNMRWRNSSDKRLNVSLGRMAARQFPNNQAHINEMTQLILANKIEIKPDHSVRNTILTVFGVLAFFILLAVIGFLVEGT